jgi:hypothetical protein
MKTNEQLNQILEECLQAIASGRASLDDCLQRYPDLREELEPLLSLAVALYDMPAPAPSAEFRAHSPQRLIARLEAIPQSAPTAPRAPTAQPTWGERLRQWLAPQQHAQRGLVWGMAGTAVVLFLLVVAGQLRPSTATNPQIIAPTPLPLAQVPTVPDDPTQPRETAIATQLATQIAQATIELTPSLMPTAPLSVEQTLRLAFDELLEAQTAVLSTSQLTRAEQTTLAAELDEQWASYQTTLLAEAGALPPTVVQSLASQALFAQQTAQALQITPELTGEEEGALRLAWAGRALQTAVQWEQIGQPTVSQSALVAYTGQMVAWQALPTTQLGAGGWESAAEQLANHYPILQQLNGAQSLQAWQGAATQLITAAPATADFLPITIPPAGQGQPSTPAGQSGENPGQGENANPPGQGGENPGQGEGGNPNPPGGGRP